MNKTIEYYNQNADAFIANTINADMENCRNCFLKYIPIGARILDAGCGSGRDTIAFLKNGYIVDAFDASEEICRIASEKTGIAVKHWNFEELDGDGLYDGIWACASLLHVEKKNLPDVLNRLNKLLKESGIIYASFKNGSMEYEKDGRFFNNMTEEMVRLYFEPFFEVCEIFISEDVREERAGEKWINYIGRKNGL